MEKLQQLLAQAAQLEQDSNFIKLAAVYRDIATIYYEQKNTEKNEEYLQKAKDAKTKIVEKQPIINISKDDELQKIERLPDNEYTLQLLENFVNRYKNYSLGYFQLAHVSQNLNFFDKAKENYEYFIKIHNQNDKKSIVAVYNNLAHLLRNDYFKDYEKAKEYYEKAIQLNQNYADTYNNYALLLTYDYFKEYQIAKQYYEKAILLNPKNAEVYNNLALLLKNDYFKDYQTAKQYYEKAIKLNPKLAEAYNNLASLLQNDYFKDYQTAKLLYEKAIQLNPKDANTYYNLALLLQKDYFKDYEKAKLYFEKAIEFKQNFAEAYNNLATLLMNNYFKDYEKAKLYFEKAIKLNPKLAEAYNNLAILLEKDYFKEYQIAIQYYEKAIQLNPNYPKTYNNLATILASDYFKEYEKAKQYFEKAIKLNPKLADAHYNLANLLKNDYFKDYEKAKEYYEKAIELNPKDAGAYNNLAVLYADKLKDIKTAQKYLFKAIEINKNYILTRKNLANTVEKIPFLNQITIHKLRHLPYQEININDFEYKHLFITGKNGSGKTTLLKEIKNIFKNTLECKIEDFFENKQHPLLQEEKKIELLFKNRIKNTNASTDFDLRLAYESGVFIVKYFDSYRKLDIKGVNRIEKVSLPFVNKIEYSDDDIANNKILANQMGNYLVDMDYTRLRAKIEDDEKTFENITSWFTRFTEMLKLVNENIIKLVYSPDNNLHNFKLQIKLNDGTISEVLFEELPDGFKASFYIIFEIVLQMQSKIIKEYELPGVVMIDEPELFLHIEMQKKIMPALTKLFPRVQFIVATHSAFILNSLENAVIYDLETRQKLINVSEIPENKLNEYYFKMNKEKVDEIINKISEFENLINMYNENKITKEQTQQLAKLEIELDEVVPYISDKYYQKFKKNQKYIYE